MLRALRGACSGPKARQAAMQLVALALIPTLTLIPPLSKAQARQEALHSPSAATNLLTYSPRHAKKPCNSWVFCYLPHCWSLDSGNVHTFGECWLKWQVNARAGGASASYSLTHYSHSLTHSGTTLLITHHLNNSPPYLLTMAGEREAPHLRPARHVHRALP